MNYIVIKIQMSYNFLGNIWKIDAVYEGRRAMIKNVVFDIGNVLIQFRPLEFLKGKYKDKKLVQELYELIFRSDEWIMLHRGTITEEDAVENFCKRSPQNEVYIKEVMRDWHAMHIPMEGTVEILKMLKKRGYRIYLLSNYHKKAFMIVQDRFEFLKRIEGRIISSDVKLLKPEEEIYNLLLKTYNLKPEETIFIDDTLANIESARELGIKGICFKNSGALYKELNPLMQRHKAVNL